MTWDNCYQCEECQRNIAPEEAIPTSVDDWDGIPVQLHICPECAAAVDCAAMERRMRDKDHRHACHSPYRTPSTEGNVIFRSRAFLGCDPGKSGALALVSLDSEDLLIGFECCRFAKSGKPTPWSHVCRWIKDRRKLIEAAAIERIVPHPRREQQNGKEVLVWKSPSTQAKLMEHYGICQGMLIAAGIKRVYATPTAWKGELGLHKKTKRDSRERAKGYFPAASGIHDWNAEAILLAVWASRNARIVI